MYVPFDDVMIPVNHIKPPLGMEAAEKLEYIPMGFYNLPHAAVLPQFVAVPQLDIGIACLVIILQGGEIQIPVFQEIIVGAARAPVAVADQDISGTAVEGEP